MNKIELVSLNIFDDSHIEIKVSNAENLLKYNNNTFNQYYISSLNFKYNFLNIKQMYYQNKNIYTMIKNELKKTCTQNDEHMLNDKEHTWSYEQHPKNYEHTNNKNIHYDVINLSFKKYIELKKRHMMKKSEKKEEWIIGIEKVNDKYEKNKLKEKILSILVYFLQSIFDCKILFFLS